MRRGLTVFFLITICASNVFAWGREGHRIVCRIAFQSLSSEDQKEVERLTKAYKTPADNDLAINGYPDACVFPDIARSKAVDAKKKGDTASPWLHFQPFNDWHFLNVDRSVKQIPATACHDNCVVFAIEKHSHDLQTATDDQDRAEALIFLGHWVGDVHQPLHISYEKDQGGNLIQPVTGGFYPIPQIPDKPDATLNLHSVWDSGIIRKDLPNADLLAFADALQATITKAQRTAWLSSKPLQWAQESYDITTLPDAKYCKRTSCGGACEALAAHGRVLTKEYQDEFADDVELRLEQAGTRLAALIHAALHP
jgi:nuclease S1